RLEGEHGTDQSLAHIGDQVVEAVALNLSAAGAAQVRVNDLHRVPAQLFRALHQRVLAPLALHVLVHLGHRRLANVDVRGARQMGGLDLTHRRLLPGSMLLAWTAPRSRPATPPGVSGPRGPPRGAGGA